MVKDHESFEALAALGWADGVCFPSSSKARLFLTMSLGRTTGRAWRRTGRSTARLSAGCSNMFGDHGFAVCRGRLQASGEACTCEKQSAHHALHAVLEPLAEANHRIRAHAHRTPLSKVKLGRDRAAPQSTYQSWSYAPSLPIHQIKGVHQETHLDIARCVRPSRASRRS